MFDDEFKPYLIEANTNPCLEIPSPMMARLIPGLIENAVRLAVDPFFPPPDGYSQNKKILQELCPENKFTLIFDEEIEGADLCKLFKDRVNIGEEIVEDEKCVADECGEEVEP